MNTVQTIRAPTRQQHECALTTIDEAVAKAARAKRRPALRTAAAHDPSCTGCPPCDPEFRSLLSMSVLQASVLQASVHRVLEASIPCTCSSALNLDFFEERRDELIEREERADGAEDDERREQP